MGNPQQMTIARHLAPLRRLAFAALAILCLTGSAFVVLVSTAAADSGDLPAYDHSIRPSDCDLLGRTFTQGQGCSRTNCVEGAVPFRRTFGAEACALRGQPNGYGFVSTIDVRQCKALHRRWIKQVNYCASYPNRSPIAIYNASQCTGPASVYVNLTEAEGYYDECLTPQRADELAEQAGDDGSTLTDETSLRSGTQCPYRPGYVYTDGLCVRDPGALPAGGGVVMIGDSLTWRGSDELARLRPAFTLDGEPARKLTELQERLDFFRAGHGDPDGLIIELGTSPAPSFRQRDLKRIVKSLPAGTDLMFVLPYYQLRVDPVVVSKSSVQVANWMRSLARSRRHACVADWPAYVRSHSGILQDGVHTKHAAEGRWARWISQEWGHC
jgi:hypothetical protein